MKLTTMIAAAAAAVALGLAGLSPARAVTKGVDLPPDGVQLKPSSLPGYAKAQAHCVACHSAEYMQYQMAKRMKMVFKAPIADDDIPVIVDYLVKVYGNEQPK